MFAWSALKKWWRLQSTTPPSPKPMEEHTTPMESVAIAEEVAAATPEYDTSLTEAHLYLEEEHTPLPLVQGVERQVGWEDISLPRGHGLLALLRLPGVVVFPGETVPLRLLSTDVRALVHILLDAPSDVGLYHRWVSVQSFLRGTKTFGIASTSSIGCVVEICSIGSDVNGEYCITKGCARFKVVEDPDPRAAPLTRCCHINDQLPRGGVPRAAFDTFGTQLSYWPRSVWRRFDPAWLGQQLLSALHASGLGLDPPLKAKCDPMALSFWVSANLPVDVSFRLLLQEAPTFHIRCELLIGMLRDLGDLRCGVCGSSVASQKDVFSLSETGAAGTFVNPTGYVHQMLTLRSLAPESFVAVGEPETAHSWFPGYAWTICNCTNCLCHLGWMFTATPQPLKPALFYGLRHSALRMSAAAVRSQASGGEGLHDTTVNTVAHLGDFSSHPRNNEASRPPTAMLRAWHLAARQRLRRLARK